MASDTVVVAVQPGRPAPWRDPRLRGIALQVVFVAVIAGIIGFLAYNTTVNLRRQNIATGFGFLEREAAFGIGESLIAYSPADTYARAFLVGLSNTLYVSAIGVVLATIVGTVMGLARLSRNWLVATLTGGTAFSPEFGALLIGPVIYTASFIAEIVRAVILAVSWGQSEAAMALGLRPGQRMRLVVLPQALRVIIPPMTSEYLSLTKNSSLAVIIGYPDLVSIANTTLNQTGQAVEGIAMIMAVYLAISLLISLFMNLYNRAVALVER